MSEFPCEFCRKADGVHASTCYIVFLSEVQELLNKKTEEDT